jgi:hypothetical protein
VHELVVHGIEPVFDGALEVGVDVEGDEVGPPARLVVFGHGAERRPFGLGQVAEKREHDAVTLDDGVGVDLGPGRDGSVGAEGGDQRAPAGAVELPAVVGAGDASVDDASPVQGAAAVHAGVCQHVGLPVGTAEGDEGQPEDAGLGG